ncbi:leucine-rich repeat neuronal protein 3-like isoform X2 [Ornithodoros turicata]|uniref:leucine-rich repeat neuronal protein 3-like isoform X2 n=1 Tax=Ornithodoros turicata TaxID=34597 RepID=UPI0031386797
MPMKGDRNSLNSRYFFILTFILALKSGALSLSEHPSVCELLCSCRHNGSIVSCSQLSLHDVPQSSLFPPHMEVLNLSRNDISELKPLSWSSLKSLSLEHNKIHSLRPYGFARLFNLEALDLSNNNVGFLDPDALDGLEVLSNLSLVSNQLAQLHHRVFHRVPNLRRLSLRGNPLKYVEPDWFTNLDVLEYLDLRDIQAYSLPDNAFALARKLSELDLSDNDFEEVPRALRSARHLEILRINSNPLSALGVKPLAAMTSLKEIYATSMMNLMSVEDGTFARMPFLEVLDISHCPKLTAIQANVFSNGSFPRKRLKLVNNSLETLETSLQWCSSEVLLLSNNPWNCDCRLEWMRCCSSTLNLKCHAPTNHKGKTIEELRQTDFTCSAGHVLVLTLHSLTVTKLFVVGSAVILVLAILGVGVVYWCRRRSRRTKRFGAVYYLNLQKDARASWKDNSFSVASKSTDDTELVHT